MSLQYTKSLRPTLDFLLSKCLVVLALAYSASAFSWTFGVDETQVHIPSYTPNSMHQVVFGRQSNWKPQTVTGILSLPKSASENAPVPVMVISHGSGGMAVRMQQQWVDAFAELGMGSLMVDSFTPRGIGSMVSDQTQLSSAANMVDAFAALKFLAADSRVDASRIGIIGFSKGGEVAFRTAIEPLRKAVLGTSGLKFGLHIPMYAGCNQVYWSPQVTGAPILNLIGLADDYSLAAPCAALAKRYADAGVPIQTIAYEDAHHAWDSLSPVSWFPNAISASSCGVTVWDIETWDIVSERTGEHLKGAELQSWFDKCSHRGVHYGGNRRAFKKSRDDVQVFVKAAFHISDK